MINAKNNILAILSCISFTAFAQNDCEPGAAIGEMNHNNVKFSVLSCGDMWSDLIDNAYKVPKESDKSPLYAGALWIGGLDEFSQLHTAAMTYRQAGSEPFDDEPEQGLDFWPGPINSATNTELENCNNYDQIYIIKKADVHHHVYHWNNPGYEVPPSIMNWPGDREDDINEQLAPYEDVNGNGYYDPENGDYPKFDIYEEGLDCDDILLGEVAAWWVFNDRGNLHIETQGLPFGIEVHAMAYTYQSEDVINDTSFYQYKIINRSDKNYSDVYMGQWVDPDLGNYQDDYIICDIPRNLGACYNGDLEDETIRGYGFNPPAIGIKFLQGPTAPLADGLDNNNNGIVDEENEDFGMTKFMSYVNINNTNNGNPNEAVDYYNYLRSKWLDNQQITYGQQGMNESAPATNYMYPGNSNPNFDNEWSENSVENEPNDRRFLMSMGPMDFTSGETKSFSFAAIWSRGTDGPLSSLEKLKTDSDIVQEYYDNCFNSLELAIEDNYSSDGFLISPNPAKDYININWENSIPEMEVSLYNAQGQLLHMEKIQKGSKLKVSDFPTGIYTVYGHYDNVKIMSEKLIIQH